LKIKNSTKNYDIYFFQYFLKQKQWYSKLKPGKETSFAWQHPNKKHLICVEFKKKSGTKSTLRKIMQIYSFNKLKTKEF